MTLAELESAIAALTAKKQRLRESFDRLAACSPVPIPFCWEDLDAHFSSVQSTITARFLQLDSTSLHPAFTAGGRTTVVEQVEHPVEHLAGEGDEPRIELGSRQEAQESTVGNGEEAKNAYLVREHKRDKGEVGGASDGHCVQQCNEAGNEMEEGTIEVSLKQDDEDEVSEGLCEAMEASPRQCDVEDEAANANADQEGEEVESEEEGEAKGPRPRATAVADREKDLAHTVAMACASMDASTLVDVLCWSSRSSLLARRAFLPALLGAADPHALVVRAVGGFLGRPGSMTFRSWGNCVALLDCVSHLTGTAGPSADTLEQAERVAWDWKEMMVGKTGSCRDMSRLSGWGLFTFLASYNIVLDFEADEIIQLFHNLPPQLKENCIDLCKQLGLIRKMTDLFDCLIENGQPLDAMRLACALNLSDKCPLYIMHDYIQRAKNTADEILNNKESVSVESLNQTIDENVNALTLSWRAVDECNVDSVHRYSIKEEICQLLHKYAVKQQSLAGVSAFVSTSHQQQSLEEQCQLQKERELQQKPGGKRRRQQLKTCKSQHKLLQNQQEQGWKWQNSTWRRPKKKQKRKQCRQKWQNTQGKQQQQHQFNKRPKLSSYSYSGIRRVPFAEHARLTQHLGPHDGSKSPPDNVPQLNRSSSSPGKMVDYN